MRRIILVGCSIVLVCMALAWKPFVALGWRATHPNQLKTPFLASFPFPWVVVARLENGVKAERFTNLRPTGLVSYSELVLQRESLDMAAQPENLWLAERSAIYEQHGLAKTTARRYSDGAVLCAVSQMEERLTAYCRSKKGFTASYVGTEANLMSAMDVLADIST
jgi:hypothetical protein